MEGTGVREPIPGRLLVANPLLPDANFDRTVVLVLARDPAGVLGVVLNRPGGAPVADILPQWAPAATDPGVVFEGGPVCPDLVVCVVRTPAPAGPERGWSPVTAELATVDLDLDPAAVVGRVASLRVFAGYAGWGPGQLEAELEAGAWWVLEGRPSDVASPDPDNLWSSVLRRQGGSLQLVSSYPDDPSAN
jgi:putative transcriptional regulator